MGSLIGGLGGAVAYGIDWGADYAPVGAYARAAILAGAGTVTAVGVHYLASPRAGAGIMGGTSALLIGRLRQAIALSSAAKKEEKKGTDAGLPQVLLNPGAYGPSYRGPGVPLESGQVYARPRYGMRPEAGVVREAGAMLGQQYDYASTMRESPFGRAAGTFKHGEAGVVIPPSRAPAVVSRDFPDAGASRYVPGPIRWFGPQSWAYRYDAAQPTAQTVTRYTSAHNR